MSPELQLETESRKTWRCTWCSTPAVQAQLPARWRAKPKKRPERLKDWIGLDKIFVMGLISFSSGLECFVSWFVVVSEQFCEFLGCFGKWWVVAGCLFKPCTVFKRRVWVFGSGHSGLEALESVSEEEWSFGRTRLQHKGQPPRLVPYSTFPKIAIQIIQTLPVMVSIQYILITDRIFHRLCLTCEHLRVLTFAILSERDHDEQLQQEKPATAMPCRHPTTIKICQFKQDLKIVVYSNVVL